MGWPGMETNPEHYDPSPMGIGHADTAPPEEPEPQRAPEPRTHAGMVIELFIGPFKLGLHWDLQQARGR